MTTPYDSLYDYQKQGVNYLVEHGGGFCWDEPGLGKTRQAIVSAKRIGGPVLVLCPNALKSWWVKEIRKLYPNDKIISAGIGGRFGNKKHPMRLEELYESFPFWTIVHYEGARLNLNELYPVPWRCVVADECHYIKNRAAQRTKAVKKLTPPLAARIGLTATPFGKNPADLWSQFNWMVPASVALRSYWKFYNNFVDFEMERRGAQVYRKVKGGKNLRELAVIMSGFGIQRTKAAVAADLPPLIETFLPLDLEEGRQFTYHRKIAQSQGEAQINEQDIVIPNVLSRISKLQQLLSCPWIFDETLKGIKLQWLLEWAEQQKYPAVIATHFKATAQRVASELGCGSPITGDLPVILRDSVIKQWTEGKHQFLVGTIATIGVGLNLQHAHTLVSYDQVHDPILMEQLKHRIHRIDSTHPVEVIYPYVVGTTNEVIKDSFTLRLSQMEFVKRCVEYLHMAAQGNES